MKDTRLVLIYVLAYTRLRYATLKDGNIWVIINQYNYGMWLFSRSPVSYETFYQKSTQTSHILTYKVPHEKSKTKKNLERLQYFFGVDK